MSMTCYTCEAKDVTIDELRQTIALLEERLVPLDGPFSVEKFSDMMRDAYATLAKLRPEAPKVPWTGNDFERRLFYYMQALAIWGRS